ATPAGPRVTWLDGGDIAESDGAGFSVSWSDAEHDHYWEVIAPPTVTSPLDLPRLPAALASHRPATGEHLRVSMGIDEADYRDTDARRVGWARPRPAQYTFRQSSTWLE